MEFTKAMKLEKEILEIAIDQTDHNGETSLRQACYGTAIDLENRSYILIDWIVFDGSTDRPPVKSIKGMTIKPKGRDQLDSLREITWSAHHW